MLRDDLREVGPVGARKLGSGNSIHQDATRFRAIRLAVAGEGGAGCRCMASADAGTREERKRLSTKYAEGSARPAGGFTGSGLRCSLSTAPEATVATVCTLPPITDETAEPNRAAATAVARAQVTKPCAVSRKNTSSV